MDEEIERLLVSVRADTGAFARDVAEMKGQLEGPLADGLERAGRVLENALLRAVRTGKFGFEDLKRTALAAMAEIAAAAIRGGIQAAGGGGGKGGCSRRRRRCWRGRSERRGARPAGRWRRAGPIWSASAGRSCSCPPRAGRVETGRGGGAREIRMSINVSAPAGESPQALARSGRQVARAVKQALMRVED
jgi:hypothetical protein